MVCKVTPTQRAYAILLREKCKYSFWMIAWKSAMSKSSAHRFYRAQLEEIRYKQIGTAVDNVPRKRGPSPRLNDRDKRAILRTIKNLQKTHCNFTVIQLVAEAGIDPKVAHRRTFSRYLNCWGYHFLQSRKKGLLSDKDKDLRLKHARVVRGILKDSPDFFTQHIAFYLDGVSFVHKYNPMNEAEKPKARIWRKKGEGLNVTAKGTKELAGGRRLHLMVAVAYGKGVMLCQPYEKLNGCFFAQFIRQHFNITFGKAGPKAQRKRIFVMDNDPSQTSKKAMEALNDIEAELHRLPSRSQDLNPPENIFHLVKMNLEKEALERKITNESFEQFRERVFNSFQHIDTEVIDKTIESLPRRIHKIIALSGGRTKY